MKYGEVSTSKVGSASRFKICSLEDWENMTEEQQEKQLLEALWDSGVLDIHPIDED